MGLFPPLRPHFDAALRDVGSENAAAREAAAESLSRPPEGREEEARAALRPLVDDPSSRVRARAMASLGQLRDAEALDAIVARFEDQDVAVRQIALIAAGEIGDPGAAGPLRRALRSDAPDVRFQAIASLAALRPEGVTRDLGRLVEDPDDEVRAHLADALGALEDPDAARPLARLLEDRTPGVRHAAAIGLARVGDDRGAERLVEALDDEDRFFEAAWAIGELGVEAARPRLVRATTKLLGPLAFKAAAAAALIRLDDPRGVTALRSVLRAVRWDARSYAVELVGELRALELAEDVVALVRRPRGADPVVVARAHARLAPTHVGARAGLEELARRSDEAGREARALLSELPPAGDE